MSCPDCFKGAIHDHDGEFNGSEQPLHSMRTYVTNPPPGTTNPSPSTIIFLCDAFGLELINNKILADRYAAGTGCRVVMPDCIPGGPMPIFMFDTMDTIMAPVPIWDIWGQLKRVAAVLTAIRYFVPIVTRGAAWRAYPSILDYTRQIKAELGSGGKVGVAGFCWGGWPSTTLCKEPAVPGGSERLIDAQFTAHPSAIGPNMVVDAITAFKTPYALALGSKDFVFTKAKSEQAEATLREKTGSTGRGQNGYEWEFKYYEGCNHGFNVRAAPGNKVEMQAAEEATEQAIAWFKKHLT